MKKFIVFVGVCFVVQLFYNVQAHPHRSIEDTEEDTSSETESAISPAIIVNITSPSGTDSHVRDMSSHENKSHEEEDGSSEEEAEPNQSRMYTLYKDKCMVCLALVNTASLLHEWLSSTFNL